MKTTHATIATTKATKPAPAPTTRPTVAKATAPTRRAPTTAAELVASIQPRPDVPPAIRHGQITLYPGSAATPLKDRLEPTRRSPAQRNPPIPGPRAAEQVRFARRHQLATHKAG
jgi:hypothetical protein